MFSGKTLTPAKVMASRSVSCFENHFAVKTAQYTVFKSVVCYCSGAGIASAVSLVAKPKLKMGATLTSEMEQVIIASNMMRRLMGKHRKSPRKVSDALRKV